MLNTTPPGLGLTLDLKQRVDRAEITIQATEDAAGEADIATATTAPGSTSQRTFERLGFQVLYNRAVLIKA